MQETLFTSWKNFIKVIFYPLVLVFIILSIITLYLTSCPDLNNKYPAILTFLNILATLFAGFAGWKIQSIITKSQDKLLLEHKGKSAFRNLIILLNTNGRLKNTIEGWLSEQDDITKIKFEEINRNLETFNENIINSIEDWNDILPEANITKTINEIKDKESNYISLLLQTERLEQEKNSVKEEKQQLLSKLIDSKAKEIELINEIYKLKSQSGINYGTSGYSGQIDLNRLKHGRIGQGGF